MAVGGTLTRKLQAIITADASRFIAATTAAGRSADTLGAKLRRGVARAAPFAAAGLVGVAIAGKKAVDSAADMNEALSKNEVLFGSAAGEVAEWSKTTATGFGISRQSALDAAGTFAVFGKSAGITGKELGNFSQDFAELAGDLASFHNSTPEEAIQAIGSALRGEAEPMRRFGVLLDDARMREEALRLGLIKNTKEALSPQNKVLAAQALIYKDTADAQGDFGRTAGSATNKQRTLTALMENLSASLGEALLPALETVVGMLVSAATWMSENERVVKIAIVSFAGLAATILALNAAFAVAGTIGALASPLGIILAAAVALGVGFVALWKNSEEFRDKTNAAFTAVKNAVLPAINSIVQTVRVLWPSIKRIIIPVITAIVDYIKAGFQIVSGVVQTIAALFRGDFSDAINGVKTIVRGVFGSLGAIIRGLIGAAVAAAVELAKAIAGAIKRVPEFMAGLAGAIVSGLGAALTTAVSWVGERFVEIGSAIVQGIKTGISNAWGAFKSWLLDKLGDPITWAKSLLGIGSPSRVFAEQVGAPMAQGLGVGFSREMKRQKPKLLAGVVAAVREARGNLASLGQSFGSMAARAVSSRYVDPATGKTPAQLEADHQAVLDARREQELRAAVTEASDDTERARAQTELDDYLTERHIANVQAQAAATGQAAEDGVNNLIAEYNRGGMAAEVFRQRLEGLLGGATGAELGAAFADSFSVAMEQIVRQMEAIWKQAGLRGVTGLPAGSIVQPSSVWIDKIANVRKSLQNTWKKANKNGNLNSAAARRWVEQRLEAWKRKNAAKYGMARGGIVDSTTAAIIGEAGPEAVIPLSNPTGRRALADALREAGGGAGGGTRIINVSFHGVLDAREAARMLQPELNRIVSLSV